MTTLHFVLYRSIKQRLHLTYIHWFIASEDPYEMKSRIIETFPWSHHIPSWKHFIVLSNYTRQANSSSTSQKTPHIIWNQNSQHRVPINRLLVPILSQTNSLNPLTPFFKIHFNIILPSRHLYQQVSLLSGFPPKPCMHFLFWPTHSCYFLTPTSQHTPQYLFFNIGTISSYGFTVL